MKAIYRVALLILVGALGTACSKDYVKGFASGTLAVSSVNELSFPQEGATQEISFPAGGVSWSIDERAYDSSWLSVVRDGSVLKVTALLNPNGLERRTELVVSLAGGGQKVIPIFQYGTEISLRILEDKTSLAFSKDGGSQALTIETNGTDWALSTLGDKEPWYSYDINKETGKLTFTTLAMAEDDKDAKRSRRKTFYLSSGNKHIEISLMQRGYAQFQRAIPFNFDVPMTEDYILAKERELQGGVHFATLEERQTENVKRRTVLMQPTGAQVGYLAYLFNDQLTTLKEVYIKARPRALFDMVSLTDWMQDEGYKKRDNVQERYMYDAQAYYKEEADRTSYYRIVNRSDASFAPFIYQPLSAESGAETTAQGAYMRYTESPNELRLENGKITSFPTYTTMLNNEGFKYDEIVAFEAKRGMVPAFEQTLPDGTNNDITQRLDMPGVPYAHLLFKQRVPNDASGQLKYVIYSFNYSEADESLILSREPRLQGTVGKRVDYYMNNDLAYRTSTWMGTSYIFQLNHLLEEKAYTKLREDIASGYITYTRGEEDLINISPGETRFRVEYMKSKFLIDVSKKRNN